MSALGDFLERQQALWAVYKLGGSAALLELVSVGEYLVCPYCEGRCLDTADEVGRVYGRACPLCAGKGGLMVWLVEAKWGAGGDGMWLAPHKPK